MRRTLSWTPLLLLGACANLIVGEDDPGAVTATDGDYSAEAGFNDLTAPDDDAPEVDTTTEAWRLKRGQVLRTFAFRALERSLIEEARGYLQEACQLDPRDVESHCALARLYLSEGDSRAAAAYAERAATTNPNNPGARLVYAATLAETGRGEEADRQVDIAWERSGHDPALARAMVTHYSADQPGGGAAQTFVKQVLAEHPRDARSWTAAGDLFLAQGQVNEAATAYAQAMTLDPKVSTPSVLESYLGKEMNQVDPVLAAAIQAEHLGDLAGAERLYRFLIGAHDHDAGLQAGLARVLWRRGRLEAAQAALDTIDVERRTWRDHLLEAKIRFKREDWEGARGSLLLVLEFRPELRAAELLLGHVERRISGEPEPVAVEPEEPAEVVGAAEVLEGAADAGEPAQAEPPPAAESGTAEEPVVEDDLFNGPPATRPDGTPYETWVFFDPAPAEEPAAEPEQSGDGGDGN